MFIVTNADIQSYEDGNDHVPSCFISSDSSRSFFFLLVNSLASLQLLRHPAVIAPVSSDELEDENNIVNDDDSIMGGRKRYFRIEQKRYFRIACYC